MGDNYQSSFEETKAQLQNEKAARNQKTGGKIAQGLGYAFSWVPFVGPYLAVAGQAIKAGLDASAGAKMKRAAVLKENQARQLQARPISPEFIQAQKAAQFQALGGVGGYEKYKQGIQQNQAQQLNSIKNTATSGDAALVAASNALSQTNSANQNLAASDLQFRQNANEKVIEQLNQIGMQKRLKQDEQMQQQNLMSAAASKFANAGTALQLGAINTATDAVGNLGNAIMGTVQKAKMAKEENGGGDYTDAELQSVSDNNYMQMEAEQAYEKPVDKTKFTPEEDWMRNTDHKTWTDDQKNTVAEKIKVLNNQDPIKNAQEIQYLKYKLDDINAAKSNSSAI